MNTWKHGNWNKTQNCEPRTAAFILSIIPISNTNIISEIAEFVKIFLKVCVMCTKIVRLRWSDYFFCKRNYLKNCTTTPTNYLQLLPPTNLQMIEGNQHYQQNVGCKSVKHKTEHQKTFIICGAEVVL